MTSTIQGQLVERIVVHGSEQTVWELPTCCSETGAKLKAPNPFERLPITDNVHVDFGSSHNESSSSWKGGAHAVALIAAYKSRSGKRYVFMENSHGAKYSADALSSVRQWGCWMTEENIKRMATERFGRWYVNLLEMG
jgi:hypothetical protein